jgi:formamidopyrimidine-DNA glycosylase
VRKFGKIYLVASPEEVLGKLGPEPLDTEFTASKLAERLRSRKRSLKPLLLDQSFLAGVGNIYADEALHVARLHPMQRSDTLSQSQMQRLWQSIDWIYQGGQHQNYFHVYQRTDLPCHKCGTPVKKITVAQRGTHYCPTCQTN